MPSNKETSQPNASALDARERAAKNDAGKQPFVPDKSIRTLDKDLKVKEEYFDDEGFMNPWAKKCFAGVPSSNSHPLPRGGLIIRNNYTFSPL